MDKALGSIKKRTWIDWIKFVPILLMGIIAPIVVRLKIMEFPELGELPWNPSQYYVSDVFAYYRSRIILAAAILALILMVVFYVIKGTKKIKFGWGQLAFAALIVASAVFSDYANVAWSGYPEKLQGTWIWLSYLVLLTYTYSIIDNEDDERMILRIVMLSAIWIVGVGAFQAFGKDFFRTDLGARLLLGKEIYEKSGNALKFSFGEAHVYSTLYNPNMVGSYVSMLLPVGLYAIIKENFKVFKYVWGLLILGSLVMLVGSYSRSGIIAIGVMLMVSVVWVFLKMKEHRRKMLVGLAALVIATVGANAATGSVMSRKLSEVFEPREIHSFIQSVETDGQNIHWAFENDQKVNVYYDILNGDVIAELTDDQGEILNILTNNNLYTIENLPEVQFQFGNVQDVAFVSFLIQGKRWDFADTDEGIKFISPMGKMDDLLTTKSKYDAYATLGSNRVYIWTRSLSKVKESIFLGSGADTFALRFPQNDYLNKELFFRERAMVVDKAHSGYIGMALEFGGIALILYVLLQVVLISSGIKSKQSFMLALALIGIGVATLFNDFTVHTAFLQIFVLAMLMKKSGNQEKVERL